MIASGSQMDFSNGMAMSVDRGAPYSPMESNTVGQATDTSPKGTEQYQWFNQIDVWENKTQITN